MYIRACVTSFYAFSLLLQLVHGQCFLNIHLHQFQNMYNVDFRPDETMGPFCCCDDGKSTCRSKLDEISTSSCNKKCETYFVATLAESQKFETTPTMLTSEVFSSRSTSIDVDYTFQFFLSKVPIESVCAYIRYYMHYRIKLLLGLSIISTCIHVVLLGDACLYMYIHILYM